MKKLFLIIPYFIVSEATAQEIVNYEPASVAPLDKMNIIKTNVTGYASEILIYHTKDLLTVGLR